MLQFARYVIWGNSGNTFEIKQKKESVNWNSFYTQYGWFNTPPWHKYNFPHYGAELAPSWECAAKAGEQRRRVDSQTYKSALNLSEVAANL